MNILSKMFGDRDQKTVRSFAPDTKKINILEEEIKKLADSDFPLKTASFQERLKNSNNPEAVLEEILPEAFAMVREAARRTLGQRHYDVQLIGGIVLHQGQIAEMRTGEGKTLVATLPAYLNALEGKGVHVVTVNDYLSRRDAVWMGQIFAFLGLSVGIINSQNVSFLYDPNQKEKEKDEERDLLGSFKVEYDFLRTCSRRDAYAADITYGTNNEFGFDYLRDNIVTDPRQLVQRPHHYAIIDEIDSILIDESRTPLIISGPMGESESFYAQFANIASKLNPTEDYEVDEKLKAVSLTDSGITKAENFLGVDNIYTEKGIKYVHHLETAVRARSLYIKDKDYVVQGGEVMIVDAFTGRLQHGRRWSDGLHQAVEAKEGVNIQEETRAVASITFQNYFRLYKKLSGMTGTAKTSEEEFFKVYALNVIVIPTNRPISRIDCNDYIYQTEQGKFKAIAKHVKELHDKGQPVLIGTISIEKNELLSAYLTSEGVPHQMLNAKNHENEGEIIAQAGRKKSVVIATNMAGRGVDIKLGGATATPEEYEGVKSLGGLYVLGTERHEARRIDNQLRGRAGRQGDPGETRFFVSLEDELMRVFGSERIKNMMGRFGIPEDMPIENRLISKSLESAQAKIEGFHFDARKQTLEYDNVLNHQRSSIYGRRRHYLFGERQTLDSLLAEILAADPEQAEIIKKKQSQIDEAGFFETMRRIALYVIDLLWVEHLDTMDYMRSSVNLRAYGQRDPLVEYKREGLHLFKQMENNFREQVTSLVSTMQVEAAKNISAEEVSLNSENATEPLTIEEPHQPSSADFSSAGRNDLCPCGSGKKFKKCHGE